MTGQGKNNEKPSIDYSALACLKGTLVFLMGVAVVDEICGGCIAAGMDRHTPAAIVENATTGAQRKYVGTLEALPELARNNAVASPAVIIVGGVCNFSERFDWFGKKPLFGRRILVARAKSGVSRLSENLRELGCQVIETPGAEIIPLTAPDCGLQHRLQNENAYSWLVFTSGVGVNVFFDFLVETGYDVRRLYKLKIACVGPETERELGKRAVKSDYIPDLFSGEALAHGLSALMRSGERALIARAKGGAVDLTDILTKNGVEFDDVAIYEKIPAAASASRKWTCGIAGTGCDPSMEKEKTKRNEIYFDYAAFTCSSAVDNFVKYAEDIDFNKTKAICIGECTAKTAKSFGMITYVSAKATIGGMVDKILELCAGD
jgi:uroporphyrinogen III methyltransferase/synthase